MDSLYDDDYISFIVLAAYSVAVYLPASACYIVEPGILYVYYTYIIKTI